MRIGILALQGAFIEHEKILEKLGVESFEIRQKKDIEGQMDGIIIPGGESTVIGELLRELDILEDLKNMINDGMPVFGTCAGMIILADKIENDEKVHIGTMDITVKRNAYGRQLGSFYSEENFDNIGKVPMTFIRAPYITECGPKARAIATCNGNIVAAVQDNQMVTSFHPELNDSLLVRRFLPSFFIQSCSGWCPRSGFGIGNII